jgi:hypothetical protein
MTLRKKWVKPQVKVMAAGSAETAPTGTANDGGTGQNAKRRS